MTREIHLGRNGKLWYQSLPTLSEQNKAETWIKTATLADTVRDVAVTLEQRMEEYTPRAASPVDSGDVFLGTYQLKHSVTFSVSLPWDTQSAFLGVCITKNAARSPISICILDKGDANDNRGIAANVWVGVSYNQPMQGIQEAEITLTPWNYTRWVEGLWNGEPPPPEDP